MKSIEEQIKRRIKKQEKDPGFRLTLFVFGFGAFTSLGMIAWCVIDTVMNGPGTLILVAFQTGFFAFWMIKGLIELCKNHIEVLREMKQAGSEGDGNP